LSSNHSRADLYIMFNKALLPLTIFGWRAAICGGISIQIAPAQGWTGKASGDVGALHSEGDSSMTGVGKAPEHPYIWPMARGPIGSHATSPYRGPRNLSSSSAWKWHQPGGRFSGPSSNGAMLIDDKKNFYTAFGGTIYKFSPDGRPLWNYTVEGYFSDIPALMDGVLYTTSLAGHVEAISMESGTRVWKSPPVCTWESKTLSKCHSSCDCSRIGIDIGAVAATKGVVIVKTHQPPGGGACRAAGLNASNGAFLWDYASDHMIWNFYPMITDDGTSVLFQDSTGGVYRLGLDGKEIWKAGVNSEGWRETFTDGGLQTGPNGVVYAVKALGGDNVGPGCVRAYRIADGAFLWQSPNMAEVPNSWPVIGRMREDDPLTMIVATGKAAGYWPPLNNELLGAMIRYGPLPKPAISKWLGFYSDHTSQTLQPEVWALDADTGKMLWKWAPPAWKHGPFRAEFDRIVAGQGPCMPNPVGNPTLDANGNFYIGMLDGIIYHLARESDGPGVRLASTYDAEAAFSSGGVSIAPEMMAIASCDTMFVFKDEA